MRRHATKTGPNAHDLNARFTHHFWPTVHVHHRGHVDRLTILMGYSKVLEGAVPARFLCGCKRWSNDSLGWVETPSLLG